LFLYGLDIGLTQPLTDIRELLDIEFVMKGGKVFKQN